MALSKKKKQAHFYAYGQIGEQDPLFKLFTGENDPVISPEKVLNFIADNPDADEYIVHINSRGGSVDAGFAIHDLFANSGKDIVTIAEGLVASIATVIMLAGKTRQWMENAQGMVHNPWVDPYNAGGMDAEALQKMADDVKREEDRIVDFYVRETKAKREDLVAMMKDETYFNADEAKGLGFATEVLKPVKAFAYIKSNNSNSNSTMKTIQTGGKKKLTLMEKIDRIFSQTVVDEAQGFDATTDDGVTLTIDDADGDGVPAVDDTVTAAKDADGKEVATASATFKLADGSSITTDENSVITAVTAAPAAAAPAAAVVAPVVVAAPAAATATAPEVAALQLQITNLTTERDALKSKVDGFAANETKMEVKLNKILAAIGSTGDVTTSSTTQFKGVAAFKNKGTATSTEDFKAGIKKLNHKDKAGAVQAEKK